MTQGDLARIGLSTSDLAAFRLFYGSIIGFRFEDAPDMEEYVRFAAPSGQGGGFDAGLQPSGPCAAGPILYIEVTGTDATLARAAKTGGRTPQPKMEITDEFGDVALFLDNDRNRLGPRSRA